MIETAIGPLIWPNVTDPTDQNTIVTLPLKINH